MSTFAAIIDNGKTSAEGFYKAISTLLGYQGVPTVTTPTALQVVQHASGANMSVDISVGSAFISNQLPTFGYNVWQDAVSNLAIGTASALNPRIDAVVAYINMSAISTVNSNNPGALAFMDVQGTPAGSPIAPNSSAIQAAVGSGVYWILLAYVTVPQNATQIVTANIADARPPLAVHANLWGGSSNTNGHTVPNVADDTVALLNAPQTFQNKILGSGTTFAGYQGWQTPTGTFTYSANNGNKEFVINTSANLTSVLQPGMKFSCVRGTTPPTQCMSFASASSQYASIASPSGITFTGAFTCEAWVYMLGYTGQAQFIIDRTDNPFQNGFFTRVNANGQIEVGYASSNNATTLQTYQAVPLNQWIHIAGVFSSTSTKTGAIYINGALVTSQLTASAAATITQAGTLSIGADSNGASNTFFNGYISEARIWSVAQSAASIQANMAISIPSNSTNLVGYWQGNGNFNDGTTNANNLTAQNGAIPTQSGNPYNATEYGKIRAVSSTSITVYTGDAGTIPNMTLNTPQYSLEQQPYGWPLSLNSPIMGIVLWGNPITNTATATGTQMNGATLTITMPTGGRRVVLKAYTNSLGTTAGTGVLDGYWGSSQVVRAQEPTSTFGNSVLMQSAPFYVQSGQQTFSLDLWTTSAGTASFGGAVSQLAWFTVEEA